MNEADNNAPTPAAPRPLPMQLRNQLLAAELMWSSGHTHWQVVVRADARAVVRIPGLSMRDWLHDVLTVAARGDRALIWAVRTWRHRALWRECVVGGDGTVTWSTLPVCASRSG
ncbi:hypothetical protein OHB12_04920 [Nocardia sp. NBC_01730]|uniref:hypothetical protein n=1 Tax=Nocardia sp. NBC_01730 TaxID=2975998 RepID=UPI002E102008|nr:hypothetical protein OHB12_04920 [Nocardia sp. NBC_01730]